MTRAIGGKRRAEVMERISHRRLKEKRAFFHKIYLFGETSNDQVKCHGDDTFNNFLKSIREPQIKANSVQHRTITSYKDQKSQSPHDLSGERLQRSQHGDDQIKSRRSARDEEKKYREKIMARRSIKIDHKISETQEAGLTRTLDMQLETKKRRGRPPKAPCAEDDIRKSRIEQKGIREPRIQKEPAQKMNGLLSGSRIYFFPNNNVSRARALRIKKAQDLGAEWIKEWNESGAGISHVIMDNTLTYQDLCKYLKLGSGTRVIPAQIVLVNEAFVPACIEHGVIVDHRCHLYRVRGDERSDADLQLPQPVQSKHELHVLDSPAKDESLQIKPERRSSRQRLASLSTDHSSVDHPESSNASSLVNLEENGRIDLDPGLAQNKMPPDALTEVIDESKKLDFCALDSDGEEMAFSGESDAASLSQNEDFSCMYKNDGTSRDDNPNRQTINILEQMSQYYDRMKDPWRTNAYRKAITQLKKQQCKIQTAAQAVKLPGIGERLASKIEEIAWTQRLRRLDSALSDPNDHVLQLYLKIYGVGLAQANKWINAGYRTLDDLTKYATLTRAQKIGMEHYHDFNNRIPRDEMSRHNTFVSAVVAGLDPTIKLTIGGSYRRGASDSGDIDFIVTKPGAATTEICSSMLDRIIPRLFEHNYLRAGLATTAKATGTKWHGAAALPGMTTWRRIDFLFVPWTEIGAALIYFTGNDLFNRSMRLLAARKGLRLNQHGLWQDVPQGPRRSRLTQGTLLESHDERKIFELLGVPWYVEHCDAHCLDDPQETTLTVLNTNDIYQASSRASDLLKRYIIEYALFPAEKDKGIHDSCIALHDA